MSTFAQEMILDTCICKQKIKADSLYTNQSYSEARSAYERLLTDEKAESFKQQFLLKVGHCLIAEGKFEEGYNKVKQSFQKPLYVPDSYDLLKDPSIINILKDDKKLNRITELYESNKSTFSGKNTLLTNRLDLLKKEDQKFRKTPKEMDSLATALDISIDSLVSMQNQIDNTIRKEIISLLKEYNGNWPRIEDVGTDGLGALWLIVQHADNDISFQKRCLKAMEKTLLSGSGIWLHYAYLYDRVAVNQNTEQYFYTQFLEIVKDENGRYKDIVFKKNNANGDIFRRCIGFPSVDSYKEMVLKRWNK